MNKTVLITGGTRGIGAALVKAFAKEGYNVAFTYKNSAENAEEICNIIKANGGSIISICADSSVPLSVSNAVEQAVKEFGKIDVLVNNSGIAQQKLFTDISDDDWSNMINNNLSSTFYYCRQVLPQMISRKNGCIINISSMWGEVGASCEVHYSAAKAGVIGLTKALAKEVGPSGIRVNCISPGVIRTDMLADFTNEDIAALAEETPLGRIGKPQDIAAAALFLASDESSFITGQVLGVNGGFII
ncbi:MAG: SDR family oxidoreductase [Clostridia bacterium]|nr:SDR family oxidoreductase [Clostridia bacterium]